MAKQKPSGSAPTTGKPLKRMDVATLAGLTPTESTSHPEWIKQHFPAYVDPHTAHLQTGVREFAHAGHVVRITTTYKVEVDGREVQAHLSVDEDGRVFTHALPFVSYGSAVDLMKSVIDAYADDFGEAPSGHGPHGHGSHGHPHQ